MTHNEAQDIIAIVCMAVETPLTATDKVNMAKALMERIREYEKPVTLRALYEKHHCNATELNRRYGFNRHTVMKHLNNDNVVRVVEENGKHYLLAHNDSSMKGAKDFGNKMKERKSPSVGK